MDRFEEILSLIDFAMTETIVDRKAVQALIEELRELRKPARKRPRGGYYEGLLRTAACDDEV
jgi:hypothetical protein